MVIDEFKTKSFFFLLSLCNCKLQFRAQQNYNRTVLLTSKFFIYSIFCFKQRKQVFFRFFFYDEGMCKIRLLLVHARSTKLLDSPALWWNGRQGHMPASLGLTCRRLIRRWSSSSCHVPKDRYTLFSVLIKNRYFGKILIKAGQSENFLIPDDDTTPALCLTEKKAGQELRFVLIPNYLRLSLWRY